MCGPSARAAKRTKQVMSSPIPYYCVMVRNWPPSPLSQNTAASYPAVYLSFKVKGRAKNGGRAAVKSSSVAKGRSIAGERRSRQVRLPRPTCASRGPSVRAAVAKQTAARKLPHLGFFHPLFVYAHHAYVHLEGELDRHQGLAEAREIDQARFLAEPVLVVHEQELGPPRLARKARSFDQLVVSVRGVVVRGVVVQSSSFASRHVRGT